MQHHLFKIEISFSDEQGKVALTGGSIVHDPGAPIPAVGDRVLLAMEATGTGAYEVVSREFSYLKGGLDEPTRALLRVSIHCRAAK